MKIDRDNEMLEFACLVCNMKSRAKQPNVVDCAFRYFDYEYCPHIIEALKQRSDRLCPTNQQIKRL